jgi:hypothetical protein
MKRFKLYWFFRRLYDRYLRKKDESVIPMGIYCHGPIVQDPNNSMILRCPERCPYWALNPREESQNNGYCSFLAEGDWYSRESLGLLWDACKICGINEDLEEEQ